jgi:hypothetical protein
MASTRNINTPINYRLEQRQYKEHENYTTFKYSQYGVNPDTRFAGNGLNPGQISWTELSNNAPQIESFLFGINSTNLVNPQKTPFVPEIKCLDSFNIYEKSPVLIPEPLVIEKNQRPFPTSGLS